MFPYADYCKKQFDRSSTSIAFCDFCRIARNRPYITICNAMKKASPEKNMEIAGRLAQARLRAGYRTEKEFADKNSVPQSTYTMHESGRRGLKLDVAEKYAAALGISLSWLLTGVKVEEEDESLIASAPDLQELVKGYARLDDVGKNAVRGLIEALSRKTTG